MKRLVSLLLCVLLALIPLTGLAKTSSQAIDAPSGDTVVFTLYAGEKVLAYTWDQLFGQASAFETLSGEYGAKVDGEQAAQVWEGIALSAVLADAQQKLGAFPADARLTALAADGYDVPFDLAEALDESRHYLLAPEPVKNFDGDATYDDSYLRILRGDSATLSNQANIRCVTGLEVTAADGQALTFAGEKPQGSAAVKTPGATAEEMLNARFYLAVSPADGSQPLYYYYSLDELKAAGQTNYAFNYDDHTVDKTVSCNGVFLTDLVDALADEAGVLLKDSGKLTESMKIQIIEEDGFHSNYSGKAASYVDEISYARTTTLPLLVWEIKETYRVETEYNKSWADFRWADQYAEYLRIYRNTGAANSAVCKMVMGAVISAQGDAYNKETMGQYALHMESARNPGVDLAAQRRVAGVLKGMTLAVRAPQVANAAVAGDSVKLVTIGEESQEITFTYEESPYLTLSNGTDAYQMALSDLILLSNGRQIPESLEAVEALAASGDALVVTDEIANAESGELTVDAPARNLYIDRREVASGTDPYGYGNLILYRYFGAPLAEVVAASGLTGELTLNGTVLGDLPREDVFVAYKHTCSKATPNNPPEGKRVTAVYEAPVLISVKDGSAY